MEGNTGSDRKRIRVECYSGHKAEERPVAFEVDGQKRVVENIIDQWAGEDHTYFKLLADDHRVYLVRYNRFDHYWTLEKVIERLGTH